MYTYEYFYKTIQNTLNVSTDAELTIFINISQDELELLQQVIMSLQNSFNRIRVHYSPRLLPNTFLTVNKYKSRLQCKIAVQFMSEFIIYSYFIAKHNRVKNVPFQYNKEIECFKYFLN